MSHAGRGVGLYVWKTKGRERGMWKREQLRERIRDRESWITWVREGDQGAKRGVSQIGKGIKEESEASREAKRSAGLLTVTAVVVGLLRWQLLGERLLLLGMRLLEVLRSLTAPCIHSFHGNRSGQLTARKAL